MASHTGSQLKAAKASLLAMSRDMRLFSVVGRSQMRRNRLLIVCYHGVSSGDENQYQPEMFLSTTVFERRMQILRDSGANVLDLGEGLQLLSEGRLPPRSTVLTFDDGWADFRTNAFPILQRYGFPATVYLTTYYCFFNRPIFRFAVGYLLWKRRTEIIENTGLPFLAKQLDLRSEENRSAVMFQLDHYAKQHGLSGKEKHDLAAKLADILEVDYEALLRGRLFHLMNPEEVTEIARRGVDVQLHTHRHRTPLDRDKFVAEIAQNRRHVEELAGKDGRVHFCYPSGAHRSEFLPWLEEAGVRSATTCVPGFSRKAVNPLLLPRLLDQYSISETEFEAWIAGFAAMMPRRKSAPPNAARE
ncbi:MAG: polysaccharide deacetylase family protein [Candidatus Korobacteraceae bacterium]